MPKTYFTWSSSSTTYFQGKPLFLTFQAAVVSSFASRAHEICLLDRNEKFSSKVFTDFHLFVVYWNSFQSPSRNCHIFHLPKMFSSESHKSGMDFVMSCVETSSFFFYSGSSSKGMFDLGPTWGEVATCKLFASSRPMSGPRACLWNENIKLLQRKSYLRNTWSKKYRVLIKSTTAALFSKHCLLQRKQI